MHVYATRAFINVTLDIIGVMTLMSAHAGHITAQNMPLVITHMAHTNVPVRVRMATLEMVTYVPAMQTALETLASVKLDFPETDTTVMTLMNALMETTRAQIMPGV